MLRQNGHDERASAAAPHTRRHNIDALEHLLAAGWRIDQPVLARLSWAQRRSGELAYHFILSRDTRRSLVVIAESPELHRFLAEHALALA